MKRKEGLFDWYYGIEGGIFVGALVFIITLLANIFNIFPATINIFMDFFEHLAYDLTYFGAILGAIYGFVLGFLIFSFYQWIVLMLRRI